MHVENPIAFALLLVLSLVLWLWVAVDVRGRADLSGPTKRRWIVAAFVFPVPVSIVYLIIGRRRAAPSS
jgi:hypothetical protein